MALRMGNVYASLSGLDDEAAAHVAASKFVHKMASVAIPLLLQIPFPRRTFTYQSLWELAYTDIGVHPIPSRWFHARFRYVESAEVRQVSS
jgi:hypothetical protein